jgi:protein-tyrosine phosphatase
MPLTELSFGMPGRIFRSPMPFGAHDPHGALFRRFIDNQISVVVLLAEEEECLQETGRNLQMLYHHTGMHVLHLPIPDLRIPAKDDLDRVVQSTIEYAQAGHHIVIHCSAGIGRTGLFAAYLAKRVFSLSGQEALQWIRRFIPQAVETPEQEQLLLSEGG